MLHWLAELLQTEKNVEEVFKTWRRKFFKRCFLLSKNPWIKKSIPITATFLIFDKIILIIKVPITLIYSPNLICRHCNIESNWLFFTNWQVNGIHKRLQSTLHRISDYSYQSICTKDISSMPGDPAECKIDGNNAHILAWLIRFEINTFRILPMNLTVRYGSSSTLDPLSK